MYLNDFFNDAAIPLQTPEVPETREDSSTPFPFRMKRSKGPEEVYGHFAQETFGGGSSLELHGTVPREAGPRFYRWPLEEGLDLPVRAEDPTQRQELEWVYFPQYDGAYDYTLSSTYVALDLRFDDGTRLSSLGATTRDGIPAEVLQAGRARMLIPRQWHRLRVDLDALVANGKIPPDRRIDAIEIVVATEGRDDLLGGIWSPLGDEVPAAAMTAYRDAAGEDLEHARVHGYIAWVRIGERPRPTSDEPVDMVNILRGTHDARAFSRGLTVPAVAVPQGFNFFCPMTERPDPSDTHKVYEYQASHFAGITLSHEPSVWVGDRATFQWMALSEPTEDVSEARRLVPFRHEHELAKPYAYEITELDGAASDVNLGVTPSMHGGILRFTFGETATLRRVVLDSIRDDGTGTLVPDRETNDRFHAVVRDVNNGMQPLHIVGLFDRPWTEAHMEDAMRAKVDFDDSAATVTLRIGTSFIDEATAWENLADEVGHRTYDQQKEMARTLWRDQLAVLDVPTSLPEAQREAIYSNLYRLYLYPTTLHEGARPRYRSPYASEGEHPVRKGKLYYNNGFWDTFRTAWPAYALLTPSLAAAFADGIIEHGRASGWIPRWVAPGGTDSMVGTSADIILADLVTRGILKDRKTRREAWTYASRDGLRRSENTVMGGRRDAEFAFFDGFMSVYTPEGLSWSLEGCLNDYGLALLAEDQLADDEAQYFLRRARQHQRLFTVDDEGRGWYRGRERDGSLPDEPFDPEAWGGDYTETDAWNMAFTAVHDGGELLRLHGGTAKMAERLDTLMTSPGTFRVGGYGGVIHEMLEAREIKLGRLGASNQPSHHIPSMYHIAGRSDRASLFMRDLATRCQIGGDFGQGYIGDEDNGEMSAFYLFATLGLYPLTPGLPIFTLTAPLVPEAELHMDGQTLKIRTVGDVTREPYLRAVLWNGGPLPHAYVTHQRLAAGGTLTFVLSETPTTWPEDPRYPSLDDQLAALGCWVDALDGDWMYRTEGVGFPAPSTGTETDPADGTATADAAETSPEYVLDEDTGFTNEIPGEETSAVAKAWRKLTDNDSLSSVRFTLDDEAEEAAWIVEFPEPVMVEAFTVTSGKHPEDLKGSVSLSAAHEPQGPYTPLRTATLNFEAPQETRPYVIEAPMEARWYRLAFRAPSPGLLDRVTKVWQDTPDRPVTFEVSEIELLVTLDRAELDAVPLA